MRLIVINRELTHANHVINRDFKNNNNKKIKNNNRLTALIYIYIHTYIHKNATITNIQIRTCRKKIKH